MQKKYILMVPETTAQEEDDGMTDFGDEATYPFDITVADDFEFITLGNYTYDVIGTFYAGPNVFHVVRITSRIDDE